MALATGIPIAGSGSAGAGTINLSQTMRDMPAAWSQLGRNRQLAIGGIAGAVVVAVIGALFFFQRPQQVPLYTNLNDADASAIVGKLKELKVPYSVSDGGGTGLKAHQMYMDVIGNNISNVNTTAFKSGRITFQNMLTSTIRSSVAPTELRGGINSVQVGMGTAVAGVEQVNTQGGFNTTSKVTDMAIQGDGFFVVTDGFQNFYTRDGAFDLDQNGMLVSPNTGMRVSGWVADNGVINASRPPQGGITIPIGQAVAAKKSSTVEMNGNLNGAPTHTFLSGVVESVTESGAGGTPQLAFKVNDKDTITFTYNGVTYSTPIGNGDETLVVSPGPPPVIGQAATNGGLSAHSAGSSLAGSSQAAFSYDVEYAMNQALANAKVKLDDGTTYGSVPATRADRLIRVEVIDDGGLQGGEAKLQFISQKALALGNAPSNNLDMATALRNRQASGLEKISTTIQVYDTLGNPHDVNVTYEKVLRIEDTAATIATTLPPGAPPGTRVMVDVQNTWKWYVSGVDVDVSGTDPTQLAPNNKLGGGWGYIKFDATGGFRSVETRDVYQPPAAGATAQKDVIAQPSKAVVLIDWANGASDNQLITLDLSRLTELQNGNTVAESKNDGFATGTLNSFTIGADGVILGQYTNGRTNALAQVALASFPNISGLTQIGSNMFTESANSGFAQIGEARTGNRGSINAGQLEMSNVDLAAQFTDMIRAQRGFQANSRVITTSDEMLQDLVNLKR
ncbi:MAG: flagellar hook-basal body complex protein [Chloroflexota bacterium]